MTKYATIVFLNDYDDAAVDAFLNGEHRLIESAEDKIIDYLSQWDHGEYHDILYNIGMESKPWGSMDTVYEQENSDYILSYNTDLGYVALTLKLEGND